MTLMTLLLFLMLFCYVDSETKVVVVASFYTFLMDYLLWSVGNDWYYERIILQDLFLACLCFWYGRIHLTFAGFICIVSSLVMLYEYIHTYQSPLYNYLTTIQFFLMQAYLFALGYVNFDWGKPCQSRQRKS